MFEFEMTGGIIISTQTPERGERFPRRGGTAFAINEVMGLPVMHMHRDARPRRPEIPLLDAIENDDILFITGHALEGADTMGGGYENIDAGEPLQDYRWLLEDYVSLITKYSSKLNDGDHLFIVLWNCQAGAGHEGSIAYKIAEQFRNQGIYTSILAHKQNMRRFDGNYETDGSLRFNTSDGLPPTVFQSTQNGITEFNCCGHTFFTEKGIKFTGGFTPLETAKSPLHRNTELPSDWVRQWREVQTNSRLSTKRSHIALEDPTQPWPRRTVEKSLAHGDVPVEWHTLMIPGIKPYVKAFTDDEDFQSLTREQATAALKDMADGSIIVRKSSQINRHYNYYFVVSHKDAKEICHDLYDINTLNDLVYRIQNQRSSFVQIDVNKALMPQVKALYPVATLTDNHEHTNQTTDQSTSGTASPHTSSQRKIGFFDSDTQPAPSIQATLEQTEQSLEPAKLA